MSHRPYPAYKGSGIEWLGDIPEHWEVKRLRYIASRIGSGKTPSGGAEVYSTEGILFIRSQNVYDNGLRLDDVVYISEQIDKEMSWSRVNSGDVLLNITGASLGRTCLVPDELGQANVNQHVCVVRLIDQDQRFFVAQAMKSISVKIQIEAIQNGAAREGLNFEQISKIALTLPPLPEQQAIAAFLDRETAKIDTLVAEQERLIELLTEKRQAVISHAVTRGLDPSVPLKEPGVEWLGRIPEHWGVCAVKRACEKVTDGAHISPETENGAHPFVSTRDVSESGIDLEGCLMTSQSSYEYMVETGCQPQYGDILFSKDGTIGRTVIVNSNAKFVVASSLIILRPDIERMSCGYLNYTCRAKIVTAQVDQFVKGAGLPRISISNLLKIIILTPPLPEQHAIAAYLDEQTSKFDTLMAEARRGIDLLKERRTALISAAVTGKIDVREAA